MAFAWLAAGLSGALAYRIWGMSGRPRGGRDLFWTLALAAGCVGALCYLVAAYAAHAEAAAAAAVGGPGAGPPPLGGGLEGPQGGAAGTEGAAIPANGLAAWAFRGYYALAAMLCPVLLGLGSLWHAWGGAVTQRAERAARSGRGERAERYDRAERARKATVVVLLGAAAALAGLALLPLDGSELASLATLATAGQDALAPTGALGSAWLALDILLNVFAVASVLAVAVASAWQAYVGRAPGAPALGTAAVALGAVLAGLSGVFGGATLAGAFWLAQALAWIIMYWGFRTVVRSA